MLCCMLTNEISKLFYGNFCTVVTITRDKSIFIVIPFPLKESSSPLSSLFWCFYTGFCWGFFMRNDVGLTFTSKFNFLPHFLRHASAPTLNRKPFTGLNRSVTFTFFSDYRFALTYWRRGFFLYCPFFTRCFFT